MAYFTSPEKRRIRVQSAIGILVAMAVSLFIYYEVTQQRKYFIAHSTAINAVFESIVNEKISTVTQGYFVWDEMAKAIASRDEKFLLEYFMEMRDISGVLGLHIIHRENIVFRFGVPIPEYSIITRVAGVLAGTFIVPVKYSSGLPSAYSAVLLLSLDDTEKMLMPLFTGMPPVRFGLHGEEGIPIFLGHFTLKIPTPSEFVQNHMAFISLVSLLFILLGILANALVYHSIRWIGIDGKLNSLITVLEQRDEFATGHTSKVAEYASALASHSGFPKSRMKRLYTACLCHDLGKLMVPADILNKPDRLNDAEFEIVKTHPSMGRELFSRIVRDPAIEEIVECHHERWDGTGYPRGLSGEDIPLESRIIFVADALDALTSHRSWRDAFSVTEAYEIIEQGSGTLFDPSIASLVRKVKVTGIQL